MQVVISFVVLYLLVINSLVLADSQISSQDRPKSNFRFPSRLKIINQYDGNMNIPPDQGHFVHHLPNQHYGNIGECLCPCTKEYLPICGSDFKTYGNNCLFQCQRKCNPALQFRSCGTCEEPNEETKLPCL